MRTQIVRLAAPLLAVSALVACAQKDDPGKGGGGSSTGQTGSTGNTTGATNGTGSGTANTGSANTTTGTSSSVGGGAAGWTVVPLIDDSTDPANPVSRSGNDLVTGIYFNSVDDGYITTQGSDQTFGLGGAVFQAKQTSVTKVLFGGNRDGLCEVGGIDFHGIEKTSDGFVALAYACDVIASHDNGSTFTIASAEAGDQHGIEPVLSLRARATDTLLIGETGYLDTTPGKIGPSSVWTTIFAPQAVPPTPNPVPANECQAGPSSAVPTQHTSVYVSPDGNLVAYGASPNDDAQICVSTDGGKTFSPKVLPGVSPDATDFVPTGVLFTSATNGIAWWAISSETGLQYVYHTVDAGQTWTKVTLPTEVATPSIELASAFFAPDGMNGWMIGYNYDASAPILMHTGDAGATWASVQSDLGQKVSAASGDKLFTGFALDAKHIWIGGPHGLLLSNADGGN